VRLVLPEAFQFPVETLQCLNSAPAQVRPRHELAEVSRICIINTPKPWQTNRHLDWRFGHAGRIRESDILLGMFRALFIYSLRRGIEYFYLLVSSPFARLLKRFGVVLQQAGSAIDYHGVRIPFQVNLRESAKSMQARSAQIRALLNRRELAYQGFSTLDDVQDEDSGQMPSPFDRPLTAETARRIEIPPSAPNHPGVWRLETERSQPGPGAWRRAS
jgi:hypothetical protein